MSSAFLLLSLFGCSHSSVINRNAEEFEIINLGPNFDVFWHAANGKPFEKQLAIWNEVIEKPHQEFYEAFVWQKNSNPSWRDVKTRLLKEGFAKYPKFYPQIQAGFSSFELELKKQIARFQNVFPNSKFSLPIYAVPSPTFNGRGAEGRDTGLDRKVLAFGIDMLVERADDPDVLYSHELFHIYHADAMGLEMKSEENETLILPLWMEGFATFVSQELNPKSDLTAILMDPKLEQVSEKEIPWLASEFLKIANKRAFDPKDPGTFKKWFNVSERYRLREDLPGRCGYLLGLKLIEEIRRNHSDVEMAHWKQDRIVTEVKSALKRLTEQSGAHE